MALYLRATDLPGKPADDYEVFDERRRHIGRIKLHSYAPVSAPWFWTITARGRKPFSPDYGYAASREQAMAAFKAAWERK